MASCLACLAETANDTGYHPRCSNELFGTPAPPTLDLDLAKLHTAGLAMVGHTSISGVQRKVSLSLSSDRSTLQIAIENARYILKPQSSAFPELPENEHVTMRLAAAAGIDTPPFGLIRLADRSLAYIIARFDRLPEGQKLRQEDFCQLAEQTRSQKYNGSAELCVRLLRRFASEPGVDIARLFRRLVFTWLIGNGDMHLKNFSLLADRTGLHRLSPAYDMLSTELVIPADTLALPIDGKKDLTARDWVEFARYCRLPERAAKRWRQGMAGALIAHESLIERSYLSQDFQKAYLQLIRKRANTLSRFAD